MAAYRVFLTAIREAPIPARLRKLAFITDKSTLRHFEALPGPSLARHMQPSMIILKYQRNYLCQQ